MWKPIRTGKILPIPLHAIEFQQQITSAFKMSLDDAQALRNKSLPAFEIDDW
ncbi:hypothetical protein IB267_20125 [Ensifer sp. ENS09]|uniref:hypothetical protein n=1 Tax=Ensifer sp. ENS09 TaxID=2769263 RepID=UPI0017862F5D|nr:hypothetical protein [Ensifer sp. ENS09]MBD9650653.1 hypothetical protein [Ensifer sp. ENS09]